MTLGVANYNLYCAAHTVERHGALDAIIALGQHTRSDDVWRGMPAWSLSSTHGRTTLSVAFHHLPWTAHMIGLVGCGMPSSPLGSTHLDNVGRGIPSLPLESIHDWTTSALHDIIDLEEHK